MVEEPAMSNDAPERQRSCVTLGDAEWAAKHIDALSARIAELEAALRGALDVIEEVVTYDQPDDPWTENALRMSELDAWDYASDGRMEAARRALEAKP
jgi:hypothetical protein